MRHMGLIKNALIFAAPLLFGLALGLLALPADGKALERADFAGPSQIGDSDCVRIARQAGDAFLATAFKFYDVRTARTRYCDLSASRASRPMLSPRVSHGQARMRFNQAQ